MNEILLWFKDINIEAGNINTIITIISTMFSCYLFFKGGKKISPKYLLESKSLIRNYKEEINELSINYNNEVIENITITNFFFWNKGKKTINRSDFTRDKKIVIKIIDEKLKFLYFKIIKENNKSNDILIRKIDNQNIEIEFDYLDHNNGFIIQLIHNGTSSKDIFIDCTLKEFGKIQNSHFKKNKVPKKILTFLSPKVFDLIESKSGVIVLSSVPILLLLFNLKINTEKNDRIFSLLFITISYWSLAYKISRKIKPKGLTL